MVEDAKPGDVEAVVREQLDAASSKVVIEELVSCKDLFLHLSLSSFLIFVQN